MSAYLVSSQLNKAMLHTVSKPSDFRVQNAHLMMYPPTVKLENTRFWLFLELPPDDT